MSAIRGRRPGKPDTRETILDAARTLFADIGYDRTSMRSIATSAGVDPSLIVHYFGSKEELLSASLHLPIDPAVLLHGVDDDPDRTGEEYVRRAVTAWEQPAIRKRILGSLRSAMSNERASEQLRLTLDSSVLAMVRSHARRDQTERRAALVGSQMLGIGVTRYVLQLPGIAEMSVDELARAVGPTIQRYLFGELTPE